MSAYGQIIGRLGQAPQLNYTTGGTAVVNLSVASNRQKKDGNVADWFKITVFGRDAEVIAQYAEKGSALAFNGRLQTDTYTDREGQQRTSTYLIADSFEFVPSSKRSDENGNSNGDATEEMKVGVKEETASTKTKRKSKAKTDPDDIPF
jgi:single-strand DNA-binding protein